MWKVVDKWNFCKPNHLSNVPRSIPFNRSQAWVLHKIKKTSNPTHIRVCLHWKVVFFFFFKVEPDSPGVRKEWRKTLSFRETELCNILVLARLLGDRRPSHVRPQRQNHKGAERLSATWVLQDSTIWWSCVNASSLGLQLSHLTHRSWIQEYPRDDLDFQFYDPYMEERIGIP